MISIQNEGNLGVVGVFGEFELADYKRFEEEVARQLKAQGRVNLLVDLRDQFNLTYVFISHDLSVVEFMADRIAVMYMGRVVEFGETSEVMRAPRHPYTRALMRSILTPDPTLGLPDLHLGRGFPDPLNPPPGCVFNPRCPLATDECRQAVPPIRELAPAHSVACIHA